MAEGKGISRRELLKRAGIGAGGLAVSGAAAPQVWAAPRVSQADQTIKIGFVSPLTGPASGFGEPDPYVLGLAKAALAKGLTIGGTTYSVEVVNKDGAVDAERGRAGGERPDQLREGRPDADDLDPRGREPGLRRVRGGGRPVHLHGRAVGGLVLRPRCEAGEALAVPLHLPLLLRRRELLQHVYPSVAAGEDEQGRRRDVAERRRRQRDPRLARAAAREGRLQDRRPRRLPGRHERLHGADHEVQAGRDPDLQHVPDPARLRDLLAAGRAAGADEADQDRPDCENGTVRLAGRGARLARLQPRERRLLGADVAVSLAARRA